MTAAFVLLASVAAHAEVFNPKTFTLKNGMQVVVASNHRVPVVTHMVWYKVGAADERPGESGLAHFLEHLMFKGTKTMEPGEFSRILARNGGKQNAFTSHDYTGYYQTVAKSRLELVMRLEADRMTNLLLTKEAIEPERLVILEERRMRIGNDPSAVLREHVDATLYMNHPYGRPVIGWEHEIRKLTPDALTSFYKRWYAPNNAVLVVGGDITAEELKPLAEKYYGVIPPVSLPPRIRPAEPPQKAARRVTLADSQVRQPVWSISYLAPSYQSGATRHAYALEVMADALGGLAGQLHQFLVVERGLAISAGVRYDPSPMGPTSVVFWATPRPGISMEDLEDAVMGKIGRLREDGIAQGEVERAKRAMMARAVYARDSLSGGAWTLGGALSRGLTIDHVESWPLRIAKVTARDVKAALRAVIDPAHSVTSWLLPAAAKGSGQS